MDLFSDPPIDVIDSIDHLNEVIGGYLTGEVIVYHLIQLMTLSFIIVNTGSKRLDDLSWFEI